MILENFNPNNTKIIRKSNIELLRIFAMLLIVGNHFAGHGVMFKWNPDVMYVVWGNGSIVNKIFCSMLSLGGEIGVAVFFMITGYFNFSNNKIRLKKFINEVIFYGVSLGIISALFKLLDSNLVISYTRCIQSIFTPVTGGIWWFVTAYFFLILLSPAINQFLSRLNRGGVLVIVTLWILWYVLGKFALFPEIEKAVFFYVLGFFLKVKNKKTNKYLCFAIIAACISIGTCIRYFDALTYLQNNDSVFYTLGELFITAFIVPILALCLFTMFEKLNIGQVKFINKIASTTFGVYLIHDSMIGRQVFWYLIFKVDSFQYNQMLFPLYAIITIVLVFSICSLIDCCRIRFVEPSITRCENILIGKLTI